MRPVTSLAVAAAVTFSACVSRTTPLRPAEASQVAATRSEGSFIVDRAPLDVVLVVREYVVDQGLSVLDGGAADELVLAHPFLDDRYRVSVEGTNDGQTRVRVSGTAPGRNPDLEARVEELVAGIREHLAGGP